MNTNTKIHTKKDKDAQAVETDLTINWEGLSQEDIRAMAQQALIVKLQGNLRRADAIPATLEVNAVDYRVGTRTVKAKVDPLTAILNLSPEDRAAAIKKLQESIG